MGEGAKRTRGEGFGVIGTNDQGTGWWVEGTGPGAVSRSRGVHPLLAGMYVIPLGRGFRAVGYVYDSRIVWG